MDQKASRQKIEVLLWENGDKASIIIKSLQRTKVDNPRCIGEKVLEVQEKEEEDMLKLFIGRTQQNFL